MPHRLKPDCTVPFLIDLGYHIICRFEMPAFVAGKFIQIPMKLKNDGRLHRYIVIILMNSIQNIAVSGYLLLISGFWNCLSHTIFFSRSSDV